MKKRDSQDSGRKIAPAVPAEDAVLLDNSSFASPADTFAAAIKIINEKTGASYDDVLYTLHRLFAVMMRTLYRVRVIGAENEPMEGYALYARTIRLCQTS